jgi:hypothetical protein
VCIVRGVYVAVCTGLEVGVALQHSANILSIMRECAVDESLLLLFAALQEHGMYAQDIVSVVQSVSTLSKVLTSNKARWAHQLACRRTNHDQCAPVKQEHHHGILEFAADATASPSIDYCTGL